MTPDEGRADFEWLRQMGEDAHLFNFTEELFHAPKPRGAIGIAVSGGSDSMALLHLMAIASAHLGLNLRAATVDHGLRAGAGAEAAEVERVCQTLGIPHETLKWQHGDVPGNLQDQARRARYGLLANWAVRVGAAKVLIGHTADDQAETFLMGLARAAGLDGLSGMRQSWTQDGIAFLRPLLSHSRADLRRFLTRRGVAWAEDPSNENDRFQRVRARRALAALAPLGISVDRLNTSISNLARAQDGLVLASKTTWNRIGHEQAGGLQASWRDWMDAGPELQRRLLIAMIKWMAGADYAPRAGKVEHLQVAIWQRRAATLGGCRFRLLDGVLHIGREARAVQARVSCDQIWDNRWRMAGPYAADLALGALGAAGLAQIKNWRDCGISRDLLMVSPAIWRDDTLIAAPIAGFSADWAAKPAQSFASFILSH